LLVDYDPAQPEALDVWLLSHFREEQWDGPVHTSDKPPRRGNSNGLYAAKTPTHHALPCHADIGDVRVIGRVGLLGVVIEGETGYRAERAVVRDLWIIDADVYADYQTKIDPALVRRKLAERYQLEDGDVHAGFPSQTIHD